MKRLIRIAAFGAFAISLMACDCDKQARTTADVKQNSDIESEIRFSWAESQVNTAAFADFGNYSVQEKGGKYRAIVADDYGAEWDATGSAALTFETFRDALLFVIDMHAFYLLRLEHKSEPKPEWKTVWGHTASGHMSEILSSRIGRTFSFSTNSINVSK